MVMGVLLLQTWIWLGFKSVINIVNQQLFQLQSFTFQDTVYVFFLEFSFEMGYLSNLSSLIFCQKLLKINYLDWNTKIYYTSLIKRKNKNTSLHDHFQRCYNL